MVCTLGRIGTEGWSSVSAGANEGVGAGLPGQRWVGLEVIARLHIARLPRFSPERTSVLFQSIIVHAGRGLGRRSIEASQTTLGLL